MAGSGANNAKELGNKAFQQGKLDDALVFYTKAIQLDPSSSVYVLNRSLVHLRLSNYKAAIKDASTSIDLLPHPNPKAYFRRGLASKATKDWRAASDDFEQALAQGASNDEVRPELELVRRELQTAGTNGSAPQTDTKKDRLKAAVRPPTSATTSDVKDGLMREVSTKRINAAASSFKDKKVARDEKEAHPVYHSKPSIARPPPSTMEKASIPVAPALNGSKADSSSIKSLPQSKVTTASSSSAAIAPSRQPTNAYEFETTWRNLDRPSRSRLLASMPLHERAIKDLFGNSLTPDLLSEIVDVIGGGGEGEGEGAIEGQWWKLGWLQGLSRVKRFDTMSAFLTDEEKQGSSVFAYSLTPADQEVAVVQGVLDRARTEMDRLEGEYGIA